MALRRFAMCSRVEIGNSLDCEEHGTKEKVIEADFIEVSRRAQVEADIGRYHETKPLRPCNLDDPGTY